MRTTIKKIKEWFVSKRKQDKENPKKLENSSSSNAYSPEQSMANPRIQPQISFLSIGNLRCPVLISPNKPNPFINIGYVFIPL